MALIKALKRNQLKRFRDEEINDEKDGHIVVVDNGSVFDIDWDALQDVMKKRKCIMVETITIKQEK